MPIILEQIDQPSPEDRADLVKIYQDYPALYGQMIEPWLAEALASEQQLFAGRFNGRLLASLWVKANHKQWHIDHLCVRAITRRRGVARQVLQLLCKEAVKQAVRLQITNTGTDELDQLFTSSGFSLQGEQWLFDGSTAT